MDTGQFRSVVSRALGQVFAVVYPLDLIPHQLRLYGKAMVINMDPHHRPGQH